MGPDGRFRAPWGIALHGFFLVSVFVLVAEIARLFVKLWTLDNVPMPISVLLTLGTALLATSFICSAILCIRWQVDGVVARPRDGVLSLGLPSAIQPFVIVACVGAWIFMAGGIVATGDILLNTSTSLPWIGALVLALCGLALVTFMFFRMTRVRFIADGWGLRWDNPVWPSSTQLPWEQIARIELRGSRVLAMRIVVTTLDGHSRWIRQIDLSLPISKASYRVLVAEIAELRPPVAASTY